jgi:hypothetical protein
MSGRPKRDRTAVQPKFALFAIAGLIVLAVATVVVDASVDRLFRLHSLIAFVDL